MRSVLTWRHIYVKAFVSHMLKARSIRGREEHAPSLPAIFPRWSGDQVGPESKLMGARTWGSMGFSDA